MSEGWAEHARNAMADRDETEQILSRFVVVARTRADEEELVGRLEDMRDAGFDIDWGREQDER